MPIYREWMFGPVYGVNPAIWGLGGEPPPRPNIRLLNRRIWPLEGSRFAISENHVPPPHIDRKGRVSGKRVYYGMYRFFDQYMV